MEAFFKNRCCLKEMAKGDNEGNKELNGFDSKFPWFLLFFYKEFKNTYLFLPGRHTTSEQHCDDV